jgi:N6-adenosine-specific RNA methylase IME4
VPAMGHQWPSAITAPRGRHSAKPDIFLEMIEAYYPTVPKIELNRRGPPRLGWDAWGNEVE